MTLDVITSETTTQPAGTTELVRIRRRLLEMEKQLEWERQVDAIPGDTLSPTHKLVYRYFYPMFTTNGPEPQLVYLEGMVPHIGISSGTLGNAVRTLAECNVITRYSFRDAITRHNRVSLAPGPLFYTPAAVEPAVPRNHGGVRRPACPTCPPDTEVLERKQVRTQYVCQGCGTVLHDQTEEHRHALTPIDASETASASQTYPQLAPTVYTGGIVLPQVAGRSPDWQPFSEEGVPPDLCQLEQWMGWRKEERAPGKYNKAPRNLRSGQTASKINPAQWGTFSDAVSAYAQNRFDGAGVVLTAENGITAIDLDTCRDPATGVLSDAAASVVRQMDSYAEVSPSGKGVRIFVYATLPPGGRKKAGVEMYDAGAFLTVTGHRLEDAPAELRERQAVVAALHAQVFGRPALRIVRPTRPAPVTGTDGELIERASSAKNGARFQALYRGEWAGYPSQSEADLALSQMLAWWTGGDDGRIDRLFRSSGLYRDKWDRPCKGGLTYGQVTIGTALSQHAGIRKEHA